MAVSFSGMPATSSIYAAYASVSTLIMLLQTMFNQLVPLQLQNYALKKLQHLFKRRRSCATIVVEEKEGISSNEVYSAAEIYLCAKIRPNFDRLKISKLYKDDNMRVKFAQCEKIVDRFEEIDLDWVFVSEENSNKAEKVFDERTDDFVFSESEKRYFELHFDSKHKDRVLDSYLPFVMKSANTIRDEKRTIKLHTLASSSSYTSLSAWESINLDHPSTFETLAMEPSQKKAIVEDLDRFVRRKDFYRKVGKAWKRGYLLYGPPGTGKSSLIAAMANYLKFDVYDLLLTNIKRDSDLRKLILRTANRSILVIEDIDCTVALPGRKGSSGGSNSNGHSPHDQFSLSGLLNFIDGLWSSCGDERIIVFTTNNKDKLDPALLRPGRMDMHIHMSYLTPEAFKLLAATYLAIDFHHGQQLSEIEDLIKVLKVTPAEIAEELMKSDDIDTSLDGVLDFLQCKSNNDVVINDNEVEDEGVIPACAKCAKRRMKRRSQSGKSCGDGNSVISST